MGLRSEFVRAWPDQDVRELHAIRNHLLDSFLGRASFNQNQCMAKRQAKRHGKLLCSIRAKKLVHLCLLHFGLGHPLPGDLLLPSDHAFLHVLNLQDEARLLRAETKLILHRSLLKVI